VIADRLDQVRARIEAALRASGRPPGAVRLIAVSKNHPASAVREAYRAGQRDFGENYAQELVAKARELADLTDLRWHFIGHLQSNKAKVVVPLVCMMHTVDSISLARELGKRVTTQARSLPILLEVTVAGESSKFGWNPERLLTEFLQLNALSRLEVHGLMTIAPYSVDPERVRPVFRRLRELRDRCAELLGAPLPVLSMGMSGDLEVAIEEGATLVRVGTALFGERPRRTDPDETAGE